MRFAIVLAGALLAAGCRASLEGAPCPCLDGYVCGPQEICVPVTSGGPDPDGSIPLDGGGGDGGDDAGGHDAAPDSGGEPDASIPDAGGEPDASGTADAAAVWYEQ